MTTHANVCFFSKKMPFLFKISIFEKVTHHELALSNLKMEWLELSMLMALFRIIKFK